MSSDAAISVRTYGAGPREAVLLHGGPGAPGTMAALAHGLADAFRVLEPLQRHSDEIPLTVDRHVQDLAVVAPHKAVLVGSSWGAMLALSYAARFPDRVRGLVLVGCGTYDVDSRAVYERTMQERLGTAGVAEVERLQGRIADASDAHERDRLFASLGDLATRAQSHDLISTGSEPGECDRQGHIETWNDALRRQEEGLEPEAFAAIRVPVVMMHGAEDPHPGSSTRDVLRAVMPQLDYVEFERCGHIPWLERHARAAFLRALRERLDDRNPDRVTVHP